MKKRLISIVAPCYNEEENVRELYERLLLVFAECSSYEFEILMIDNSSEDSTVAILKEIASKDVRLKIIINNRNYGHIRSPYWALLNTFGDATINLAADLQDPPEMIPKFIAEWEKGWKVVMATKPVSKTNFLMHNFRRLYYKVLDSIADIDLVRDATGFGLYDRVVMDEFRKLKEPYPFIRGLICEFGFPIKTIPFKQPRREKGITKNNFYTLFDMAMLGIVSHSLVPIRMASLMGVIIGFTSLLVAITYFVLKLMYWNSFPLGLAPLIIGMFLMFSVLFIFIGILGEYIGSIHTYLKNRPLVIEKERINF